MMLTAPEKIRPSSSMLDDSSPWLVTSSRNSKTSREQVSPTSSITTLVPPEAKDPRSMPDTAPEQARQRSTYTSFGDDGITASTSAYGHLLQITRYFGNKPSGFFCVDLKDTPPPFLANRRMEILQEFSADPAQGMQLGFQDPTTGSDKPTMSFIHDCWPCFEAESPRFDIGIEYFISGETVYQMYTLKLRLGSKIFQETPTFTINTTLFIRSLNFTTSSDENERPLDDKNYDTLILNNDNCVMRIHKNCHTGIDDRDAVALVISPFINNCAWPITKSLGEDLMMITLDESTAQDLRTNKEIQITLAYTLKLVASSNLAVVSPPTSPEAAKGQIFKIPFEEQQFVEDSSLNFTLRRNLEHILTVCSIPIGEVSGDDEIRPVALTCGDISGHRIAAEASFFAFEFLLLAFQFYNDRVETASHLCTQEERSCGQYARRMRFRIWRASRGHLEWLLLCYGTEKGKYNLRADYWATGKEIVDGRNNSKFPQMSLTDATLSIIKFANFYRMTGIKCDISDKLGRLIKEWIHDLHKSNKNHEYVFPSVMEASPHIFHLSDHAMIWWGIKSAEELKFESELNNIPSSSDAEQKLNYSSKEIEASIFRNFITENLDSNKSTMAFSRSLAENRFKLRATDSVIFYAVSAGLLLEEEHESSKEGSVTQNSRTDAWYNTKNCQPLYKDNQDVNWSHPLQFALAIIISASGNLMNNRKTTEMYSHAKSVLLKSSSPNGLFSGCLNKSKERSLFENEPMHDSYWHTTFEVPYILWKYKKSAPGRKQLQHKSSAHTEEPVSSEPPDIQLLLQKLLMSTAFIKSERQSEKNEDRFENHTMTIPRMFTQHKDVLINKNAAFNKSINQRNVVELLDEWLYDQPEFFKFHRILSEEVIKQFCEKPEDKNFGTVITEAIESYQPSAADSPDIGYILDVPMTKGSKANISPCRISNKSICEHISQKRTPRSAKKRLFHFHNANLKTALICFLASSEAENMSSFFDKHASYDKYFVEDITTGINKWVTELHLSFYRITPNGSSHEASIRPSFPKVHEIIFPIFGDEKSSIKASRAVMSFRIDGDIFNRYWTCHVLEHNPKQKKSEPLIHVMHHDKANSVWKADPWKQRKILELFLFDSILTEMLEGTKEIIEEINRILSKNFALDFDILFAHRTSLSLLVNKSNANKIISMSPSWNRLQRILQTVQEDLDENLSKITLWTKREREQGQDRPRWLHKHEGSYRSAIFKLQALSERKIHQLQRFHTNIASLNSTLTSSLESMRTYLDRRGSDDIRLFTYVTVIFLPISFATSMFSTSSAPSGQMMANMAVTAAIAMLITTTMLVNARILDAIVGPVLRIARQTSELIASLVMGFLSVLFYPFVYPFARYFLFPLQKKFPRIGSVFETETFGKAFIFNRVDPLGDAREDYKQAETVKKEKKKDLEAA